MVECAKTENERREHLTAALLLGAVLFVGLVMRSAQMRESLWLDELHTAWAISDSLAEVAPRARMGNNSPLYFYLPWLTTGALGNSELAIRLPSLLTGLTLIGVVYGVAYRWTGHRSMALMAAALATLDRNFLFYSLEARPYVLVQTLGVLHVMTFWCLIHRPSVPLRAAWIAGAVLLFYLHYTAVLLIPAELGYYIIARFGLRDRLAYRGHALMVDLTLVVLAYLPASGHLMLVASRRESWQWFVARRPFWSVLSVFPLTTYVVLPLVVAMIVGLLRRVGRRWPWLAPIDYRLLLLVSCWLFVPLGIAWVSTQSDLARLLFRRYLMVVSVAPLLLSALIGSLCPNRAARIGVAALVVGVGLYTVGPMPRLLRDGRWVNHGDEDWRGAVQSLNADGLHSGLPVFVSPGLIEAESLPATDQGERAELSEYCLLPVRGIYRLRPKHVATVPLPTKDAGRLDESQWQLIARARGAWFLIRGDEAAIDRMLLQLRASASAHRVDATIAMRQAFVRPTDPFGLRQWLVGATSDEASMGHRRRATVTLVRLAL